MNEFETEINNLRSLYKKILTKVNDLRSSQTVYPKQEEILRALGYIKSFLDIKVVILSQDPYHGENQANGLAFSVNPGVDLPPSLQNIYKELSSDLGIQAPKSGDLEPLAKQGVILLNRSLTVKGGEAKSHENLGWHQFTEEVIKLINKYSTNIVFMLWGSDAKKVAPLLDKNKHLILTAAHPSPLSASRGFFGCKHFSKCNEYLINNGIDPINWDCLSGD